MAQLDQRRILLGITGGIAAYKSAELVRRLGEVGASVKVVMTPAATEFVTPLTFQALSGNPVRVHRFDGDAESTMSHIDLARWADCVLIAPASADFMARLAHGLADDLLSTLCLATTAPVALAPAMNQQMWQNPATQDNRSVLAGRGIQLFGPAEGDQACGEHGPGRMLEPEVLAAELEGMFGAPLLRGVRVLVTAGPTREAIDPVRFISNRSSGKMGYAVAAAAARAGGRVTLVSGPVSLPTPAGVERVDVESAEQMYRAVQDKAAGCDIFIAAAAVADYRAEQAAEQKLKKTSEYDTLPLIRTPDILASVANGPEAPFTVGFAAETEKLQVHGREKLMGKGLDMVAANWVGQGEGGFDVDDNSLHVLWADGECELPRMGKRALGRRLVELIAERYYVTKASSKDP